MLADLIPARCITVTNIPDILRECMQGEMWCRKGYIGEERFIRVIGFMDFQLPDGPLCDFDSTIESGSSGNRWDFPVINIMFTRTEKTLLVIQIIGVIKSISHRHSVDVPFP